MDMQPLYATTCGAILHHVLSCGRHGNDQPCSLTTVRWLPVFRDYSTESEGKYRPYEQDRHFSTLLIDSFIVLSAVIMASLSCARCHVSEDTIGQPLQRCAGCRSVYYCSRECQKNAWSDHKAQCRSSPANGTPGPSTTTRTTMTMNLGDLLGSGNTGGEPLVRRLWIRSWPLKHKDDHRPRIRRTYMERSARKLLLWRKRERLRSS